MDFKREKEREKNDQLEHRKIQLKVRMGEGNDICNETTELLYYVQQRLVGEDSNYNGMQLLGKLCPSNLMQRLL